MPTYDYVCAKCGNKFELFQSMIAKPQAACPKCKGRAKRQISSGTGIIFKGSGFYETDYKKKTGKKPEEPKEKGPGCPMSKECKGCGGTGV